MTENNTQSNATRDLSAFMNLTATPPTSDRTRRLFCSPSTYTPTSSQDVVLASAQKTSL